MSTVVSTVALQHLPLQNVHREQLERSISVPFLAVAAAQVGELQQRLEDSHAQAQKMQDLLEERIRSQAEASSRTESELRVKVASSERQEGPQPVNRQRQLSA